MELVCPTIWNYNSWRLEHGHMQHIFHIFEVLYFLKYHSEPGYLTTRCQIYSSFWIAFTLVSYENLRIVEWSCEWILLINVEISFVEIHESKKEQSPCHEEVVTLSSYTLLRYWNNAWIDTVSISIELNKKTSDDFFFRQ